MTIHTSNVGEFDPANRHMNFEMALSRLKKGDQIKQDREDAPTYQWSPNLGELTEITPNAGYVYSLDDGDPIFTLAEVLAIDWVTVY